jgi:hypothetical protein
MKGRKILKTWIGLLLGTIGLLFFQTTTALGATAGTYSAGLGFDFATGDYGTDQTTDSYQLALSLGYFPTERLDIVLDIPYLYQSNSSTVALGGMRFPRQTSNMTSGTGGGGMGGGGAVTGTNSSQNGLGDINATAGYILIPEGVKSPMLRPLVYAKFPTADEDKGLGTGAFDFGGGLSLGKYFGDFSTYVEALYITPGSTSSYNPDNYWTSLAAVSYRRTEHLAYGIDLSGATAAFAGVSDALDVKLKASYRMTPQRTVGCYVLKGLSDGSADYGAGLYGAISF